jgi:hypothetical protein
MGLRRVFGRRTDSPLETVPGPPRDYRALAAVLAPYFHEDWRELEADTADEVLGMAIADATNEELDLARHQLAELLARADNAELDQRLRPQEWSYSIGVVNYSPSVDGLTAREWLSRIGDRMSERLPGEDEERHQL